MPDIFDANGLQVKTTSEIVDDIGQDFQNIYGADINLDQNSPDGQIVNILAQVASDLRELLVEVNNGFDPDRAVGRILDERVVINNIERAGGTFTIVPVDIETDRTVDLSGLDVDFANIDGTGYTIQDDAGNSFILIDSVTLTAGTTTVNFRAQEIGAVETTVDTITNPVTIVQGVLSVNNSSAALQTGQNQETDAELRLRRQRSVAIASTGYLNGIQASLLALSGVTEAQVFENITNAVDADGIPAHGIWCIVEGGANADIADVIYGKKSAGADMKGDVKISIETDSGAFFIAKFDRPVAEDLHIRFNIQKTVSTATFNQSAIKDYIVDNLIYSIGEFAETSRATCIARDAITSLGGGGVVVDLEVSNDGATWVDYLETTTKDAQFTLDAARITITVL